MLGSSANQTCWTNSIGGSSGSRRAGSPAGITGQRSGSPAGLTGLQLAGDIIVESPVVSARRSGRVHSDPSGSRANSRDPVAHRPPTGSGSRPPSGSRTPTSRHVVPPLTSAQLESASTKLKNIVNQADLQPSASSRHGWDVDDLGSPGLVPISPTGSREGKSRRPHRQWLPEGSQTSEGSGQGKRPSSRSSNKSKADDSQKSVSRNNTNSSLGSAFAGEQTSTDSLGSSAADDSLKIATMFKMKDHRHHSNSRHHLAKGSRDDSFLSTISESTMSTDSNDEAKSGSDGVIDVYGENCPSQRPSDILKDFKQLFTQAGDKGAQQMQQLLHDQSFFKPLTMQRRIIPVIQSAFQDEQKSFITVQGAPQSGKTSALMLGILGAVGSDMTGIRVIALSTGPARDFKKCFDICAEVHPLKLSCFETAKRKVSFAGMESDPTSGVNINDDMQRLCSELGNSTPGMIYGHPSRVLPLLQEAPSWGLDLSNVQVLALDDAEEAICQGLMDEVCEVCTILRHFSKQRLRHIMLSHFLSNESKSMVRCLRTSLLKQNNLFGMQANKTQARAKAVNHYYAVAPKSRWPAMLAVLHNALSLPSGIIFDDESADSRARTRVSLRSLGVTASVWNALAEQRSGARAAARDGQAGTPKGPAFHLMPSDLAVLKVDLPQVRCILHFSVPKRELNVYGLRLMCLEQQEQKGSKHKKNSGISSKSLSVLFVEETETVRDLEKTYHIRMQEVPTDMLPA